MSRLAGCGWQMDRHHRNIRSYAEPEAVRLPRSRHRRARYPLVSRARAALALASVNRRGDFWLSDEPPGIVETRRQRVVTDSWRIAAELSTGFSSNEHLIMCHDTKRRLRARISEIAPSGHLLSDDGSSVTERSMKTRRS